MLSHGMHQHLGALDLYVSFFLWRLVQFEFGARVSAVLDFVQWHQKYYWDAIDCKAMFKRNHSHDIIGRFVYGTTNQPGRALVESICKNLIRFPFPRSRIPAYFEISIERAVRRLFVCVGSSRGAFFCRLYSGKLRHMIGLVAGLAGVPPQVKSYFVPLETIRALRLRSIQVSRFFWFIAVFFRC